MRGRRNGHVDTRVVSKYVSVSMFVMPGEPDSRE